MVQQPADKTLAQLKNDLLNLEAEAFVMHWVFDTVPHLFETPQQWTTWKLQFAKCIKVDAHSVIVIGSGCVGYSLSPHKNFRRFDAQSDVDVAIVSAYHFEMAWRYLREIGATLYSLRPDAQAAIKNHRRDYLFWGTIATDKILPLLPFGPDWVRALAPLETSPPVDGRPLKIRLYRDSYSLVGYHAYGARKLRENLA